MIESRSRKSLWLHERRFIRDVDGRIHPLPRGFLLAGEGSNLQPPDPKSGVLPVELPAITLELLSPAVAQQSQATGRGADRRSSCYLVVNHTSAFFSATTGDADEHRARQHAVRCVSAVDGQQIRGYFSAARIAYN